MESQAGQIRNLLFNRSIRHGSGYTTALSGMHRYLNGVYFRTPSSSLCSDNTRDLDRSTVERIPNTKPTSNVLATHQTL